MDLGPLFPPSPARHREGLDAPTPTVRPRGGVFYGEHHGLDHRHPSRNPKHFQHLALSERHRLWGFNVPCLDLDFLLTEFSTCQAVALVDYKYAESIVRQVPDTAGIRTLRNLAHRANLPAWVAFYRPESWTIQVWCLNDQARAIFGDDWFIPLDEVDYVETLYGMRGLPMPEEVRALVNHTGNRIRGQAVPARRLAKKKIRPTVGRLCHPKPRARG